MKIDAKDTIAGVPVLRVRSLLRLPNLWSIQTVEWKLKISRTHAERLIRALERREWIQRDPFRKETAHWQNTAAGNRFASATAAPLLTRRAAERALEGFLERVREVEDDRRYLWRVRRAALFGSMMTVTDRVSDVDLLVELAPKEPDRNRHQVLSEQHIQKAQEEGRRFANLVEELAWPHQEVLAFLKARKRSLAIQVGSCEDFQALGQHRLIYESHA